MTRVSQEGTQRGGQELRAFEMQARGVALDKSHDVAGAQAREPDPSVAEPTREEIADEGHVIDDRRTSQRRG
jgi:hypothetical protein